jgi:hypothetical protein
LAFDIQRVLTQKGERVVRITIVNFFGNLVLDTLVKPWGKVLDYRESITNIRKQDLLHAPSFPKVVQIVSDTNSNLDKDEQNYRRQSFGWPLPRPRLGALESLRLKFQVRLKGHQ